MKIGLLYKKVKVTGKSTGKVFTGKVVSNTDKDFEVKLDVPEETYVWFNKSNVELEISITWEEFVAYAKDSDHVVTNHHDVLTINFSSEDDRFVATNNDMDNYIHYMADKHDNETIIFNQYGFNFKYEEKYEFSLRLYFQLQF